MKIRVFKGSQTLGARYTAISNCPLCSSIDVIPVGKLSRPSYRFGPFLVPLPDEGVELRVCQQCDLMFKSFVPTQESLGQILSAAAEEYWDTKSGPHPKAQEVQQYLGNGSLLDIGASAGDLLISVKGNRLSGFDAAPYQLCKERIKPPGEYIVSTFENPAQWSGNPYDTVSAFDVFEHFLDTRAAVTNILNFLKPGGHLIIETGNWRAAKKPERWYYTNLFEHQIFWSRPSLDYMARQYGLAMLSCNVVNHKGRLSWSKPKKLAVGLVHVAGSIGFSPLLAKTTGVDPGLLPPGNLRDHFFAVLQKRGEAIAA